MELLSQTSKEKEPENKIFKVKIKKLPWDIFPNLKLLCGEEG